MVTLEELRDNSLALNKVRAVTENKDEFDTSLTERILKEFN